MIDAESIKDLIEAAYFEGWRAGKSDCGDDAPESQHWNQSEDWADSESRRAINRTKWLDKDDLKKALNRLGRYNRLNSDDIGFDFMGKPNNTHGMAIRKRGKWVLFEDVKTVICQAIADAEKENSDN